MTKPAADKSSRLPGFYDKPLAERARSVAEWAGLTPEELAALDGSGGLAPEQADHMIENVVGLHALPLGIAVNFLVNRREVLVPMAIEEPSVVAGGAVEGRLVEAWPTGPFLVAHLIYDTRDAMGANAVNTACETLAPTIEQMT